MLLLIRGDDLYKNMSSYLAQRIEQTPNIELLCNTTIRRMNGDTHLELGRTSSTARRARSGRWRLPGVFSFIGADPRTGWLPAGNREGREGVRPDRSGSWRNRHTGPPRASLFCWRPAGRSVRGRAMCGPAR